MKWVIGLAFCLGMFAPTEQAQQASVPEILKPDKFDQWGDISFNDEQTHLNKIAAQAKEWPLSIIYVVVHAGATACIGEAKARGVRAKNYLMTREVSDERIVWIDAGWRRNAIVQVWIWPPQLGKPSIASDLNLKRSQVKLEKNCRIKYRVH